MSERPVVPQPPPRRSRKTKPNKQSEAPAPTPAEDDIKQPAKRKTSRKKKTDEEVSSASGACATTNNNDANETQTTGDTQSRSPIDDDQKEQETRKTASSSSCGRRSTTGRHGKTAAATSLHTERGRDGASQAGRATTTATAPRPQDQPHASKPAAYVFNAYDATSRRNGGALMRNSSAEQGNVILRLNVSSRELEERDHGGGGGGGGYHAGASCSSLATTTSSHQPRLMPATPAAPATTASTGVFYGTDAAADAYGAPRAYDVYAHDSFASKPCGIECLDSRSPVGGAIAQTTSSTTSSAADCCSRSSRKDDHHTNNNHRGGHGGHGNGESCGGGGGGGGGGLHRFRKFRLLADFAEKNGAGEWPVQTNVHCYWCCHKFSNPPYGLPLKYANGTFYVTGCFCSLECAAAYNFGSGKSVDEMWDRYMLLNLLAHMLATERDEELRSCGEETAHYHHYDATTTTANKSNPSSLRSQVRQAPHRLALTMFGGYMGIDEFRTYCPSHRLTIINYPPMMTLTQQIEEIDDQDVKSTHQFVPVDHERIDRYQKEIKLRRNKPLVSSNNTLMCAMNIRFMHPRDH